MFGIKMQMRTGGIIRDLKSDNLESFEATRAPGSVSEIRIVHFKVVVKYFRASNKEILSLHISLIYLWGEL